MYSFKPADEQKMVVSSAKKLASKEFRSRMRDADEASELGPEWMQGGCEPSLLPARISEAYGGFGEYSAFTWILAAKDLARQEAASQEAGYRRPLEQPGDARRGRGYWHD
jgi:alkylation response protein AidB-like acyl-CoA dehydrogenase